MNNRRFTPSKVKGFTLIELLVAVAIFSGLMLVVLGSLSRSSLTLASVNGLRERSQAARQIVDQISNDWQYVYNRDLKIKFPAKSDILDIENGYYTDTNKGKLIMVLKYPRQDELTVKYYHLRPVSTIPHSGEFRKGCKNADTLDISAGCDTVIYTGLHPLLSARFGLDDDRANGYGSYFQATRPVDNKTTGMLKVELTVRPAVYEASVSCSSLPKGTCYKLSTTLTQGMWNQ